MAHIYSFKSRHWPWFFSNRKGRSSKFPSYYTGSVVDHSSLSTQHPTVATIRYWSLYSLASYTRGLYNANPERFSRVTATVVVVVLVVWLCNVVVSHHRRSMRHFILLPAAYPLGILNSRPPCVSNEHDIIFAQLVNWTLPLARLLTSIHGFSSIPSPTATRSILGLSPGLSLIRRSKYLLLNAYIYKKSLRSIIWEERKIVGI